MWKEVFRISRCIEYFSMTDLMSGFVQSPLDERIVYIMFHGALYLVCETLNGCSLVR